MSKGKAGGVGLVWLLLAMVGWAQTHQGSIRGEVTDPTGQPLRGATIELVQEETGRTRSSVTGERGEFTFSLLPPGPYRLVLEQRTTNRRYVSRVVLQVNQDLRVALAFT
ncbi:MAG: carboxypeptidase-like regulatory domain-containing protein, partial [Blastocatellia bacterium]